jgi:hypothetical protein
MRVRSQTLRPAWFTSFYEFQHSSFRRNIGKNKIFNGTKTLARRGFDPPTSGLWARRSSPELSCCRRKHVHPNIKLSYDSSPNLSDFGYMLGLSFSFILNTPLRDHFFLIFSYFWIVGPAGASPVVFKPRELAPNMESYVAEIPSLRFYHKIAFMYSADNTWRLSQDEIMTISLCSSSANLGRLPPHRLLTSSPMLWIGGLLYVTDWSVTTRGCE